MDEIDRFPPEAQRGSAAREVKVREVKALEGISLTLRVVAVVAAAAIIVATLGEVVMIIFAAVLAAVVLRGAAVRVGRLVNLSPRWGLVVVIVGLLVLLVGLGWWRGPVIALEAGQLRERLGIQVEALRTSLSQTSWGQEILDQIPFGLGSDGSSGGGMGSVSPRLAGAIASTLWSVLGLAGTFGVVVIAALYMAAAPEAYVTGLIALLPRRWRLRERRVLETVERDLWGWLVGQLLDMLIVGVLCGVGLVLLNMPLALILAIIAGLLNFVPYIGAITGAVPAVLIAFAIGPHEALSVALLYFGVQFFEGNVAAPMIQSRTINLPPALAILAQTAFGVIFGLFGIVLATPLTAAIIAAVRALREEAPDY
jgi:predicted PurR-regulated permease PerM